MMKVRRNAYNFSEETLPLSYIIYSTCDFLLSIASNIFHQQFYTLQC